MKTLFNTLLVSLLLMMSLNTTLAETILTPSDDVDVVVEQKYNEETKREEITLQVSKKHGSVTMKGILLPDGSNTKEESGVYTYEVSENGTNTFKVLYSITDSSDNKKQIDKEYEVVVETTSIQSTFGFSIMALMAPIIDNKVSVEIPGYDDTLGWEPGIVYELEVTVDFSAADPAGRQITIELAEGMRYQYYFVDTTPVAGTPQAPMTAELAQYASVSTVAGDIPVKTIWGSYVGKVVYNVTALNTAVKIIVGITADEIVAYEEKTITDAVKVNVVDKNGSLGDVTVPIIVNGKITAATAYTSMGTTVAFKDASGIKMPYVTLGYENPFYKELFLKYYYPVGAKYVSATTGTIVEVNDAAGYVILKWENTRPARDVSTIFVTLDTSGLAVGEHVAASAPEYWATMYDNETYTVPKHSTYRLKITVVDPNAFANKMKHFILVNKYLSFGEKVYQPVVYYKVHAENIVNLTDQWIEVTVDDKFEMNYISIPIPKGTTVEKVYYTTQSVPHTEKETTIFVMNEGVTPSSTLSMNLLTLRISDIENGEYFASVRVYLGDVPKDFLVTEMDFSSGYGLTNFVPRIIGNLVSDNAKITIRTFAYSNVNTKTIEPTSLTETVATISFTSGANDAQGGNRIFVGLKNAPEKQIAAGTTGYVDLPVAMTVMVPASSHLKNAQLIVKIPEYVELSVDSVFYYDRISASNKTISDSLYSTEIITRGTDQYLVVSIKEDFALFKGYEAAIIDWLTVRLEVKTSKLAKGVYKWSEIACWSFDDGRASFGMDSALAKDVLDLNNNGKTDDYVVFYATAISADKRLTITEADEVVIETYIVPNGEPRRPSYNTSEPSSAIGFTPTTEGTYTVTVLNARKKVAEEFVAYIPVPKEGNDFGSNFQETEFTWNMKVTGTPVITVYDVDGNDVSTTRASNYQISYSDNILANGSNFESATYYTGAPTTNAEMIKIEALSTIDIGEKVVIEFKYAANESGASSVGKIGKIIDFRPYYFARSTDNAGWAYGSRVGAILAIGSIEGYVFLDENLNGIFDTGENGIANVNVKLTDGTDNWTVTTKSDGSYKFENLNSGTYDIDFTDALTTAHPYFTFDGNISSTSRVSVVEDNPSSANLGKYFGIIPTTVESKKVHAGVMDYNKSELEIKVPNSITVREVNPTGVVSGTSASINATFKPEDKLDKILAPNGITYKSADTSIATVSASGVVTGVYSSALTSRTTKVTITMTDIFGNSVTKDVAIIVNPNKNPVLSFVSPTIIKIGDTFDPYAGVTATDNEDGTVSDIKVTANNVDTSKLGVYKVTYLATDSDGLTDTKTRTIIVSDGTEYIDGNYVIFGANFVVKPADVDTSSVANTHKDILTRSKASAFNLTDGSPATVTVKDTGGYTSIEATYTVKLGVSEDNTVSKTILAIVRDTGVIIEGKEYILTGFDKIRMDVADVPGLTDLKIIAAADAKAFERVGTGTGTVLIKTNTIQATPGTYKVVFYVKEEPTVELTTIVEVVQGTYVINASNATVELSDFKKAVSNDTIENLILELTGAEGWYKHSHDGDEKLDVHVNYAGNYADINSPTKINVDLYVMNPKARGPVSFANAAYSEVYTITIVNTVIPHKHSPHTGVDDSGTILTSLFAILGCCIMFFCLKKRENEV